MLSSKIEQLITVLENQELDVSTFDHEESLFSSIVSTFYFKFFNLSWTNFLPLFSFQSSNGVSPQLYAELMAAYLYKNDL